VTELKEKLTSLRIEKGAGPAARLRFRRWPLWVLVAVVAAGVLFALSGKFRGPVEVTTTTPTVITPEQLAAGQPILTASGYLVPRRRAIVSSKIQGRLSELRVEEGSRVAEGEVIARLESRDFEAQVARANAGIQRTEAAIQRASADLAEFERQLRKATQLVADGVAAVDDQEAAASRVAIARAALDQARAELAVSRGDLALAEANLSNTVIRAPFAGTVVRKMAEVGESVAPIPPGVNISTASGAIVALADLDTLEAEVDVGEANVSKLSVEQPAQVAVEAFPDRKYRGVLRQIIPSADRTKATVLVRVTLVDKDRDLKPEMSARADFLSQRAESAPLPTKPEILVPADALVRAGDAVSVFVVDEAGGRRTLRPVAVTTGETRPAGVVVTAGLAGGETIVLRPAATLKPGQAVAVKGR
jgi:RND family efflux transporter MFP subunit